MDSEGPKSEIDKKNPKWKNELKKAELKNRDISGLRRLTDKLKSEGRGAIYWPLEENNPDSDEFNLDTYLEKNGKFKKLSKKRHDQLYGNSYNFRVNFKKRKRK